ncbi:metalloregulator ArsR/SmtB family transcription factor [Pseudoalteromonas xiamenensis]|uniref:Metalloregulator ArsR/SmtB family transcription factor n=1 Tax=Pseudoalteromonas xiamenensis TaxID=882626 RepID=A0A975DJT5_9GAMM|nr:metalloregulator ArsR/SmtB family transcription factor [Pseudoalteromonas xiamenensis]QTH71631.1 metalloregulator ArsR/SmtB family transcription factor [Pseudoalteromonas xiamenensis]
MLVDFFKCLSDETRLALITLIFQEEELCVCELVEALDIHQAKISRHLSLLRKHHILQDIKDKQWVFYRIHPELAPWAKAVIARVVKENQRNIDSAIRKLNQMGERPVRQQTCCK